MAKQKYSEPEESSDQRAERYIFDFGIIPSSFAHARTDLFDPSVDSRGFLGEELVPIYDLGEIEGSERAIVRMYGVNGGRIAVCDFPKCEYSPSAVCGIGVFRNEEYSAAKKKGTDYSAPYYVLSKIFDSYAIGEIYDDGNGNYITAYYEKTDNPDRIQFLKWVMEKEHLPIGREDDVQDPILDLLLGNSRGA